MSRPEPHLEMNSDDDGMVFRELKVHPCAKSWYYLYYFCFYSELEHSLFRRCVHSTEHCNREWNGFLRHIDLR